MNTKPFVLLVVGVLVLGGSLIGAFAGGVALGKGQADEPAPSVLQTTQPAPDAGRQPGDQLSPEQLQQLRQRFPGGRLGDGAGGVGGGGAGFDGRGGLSGTIDGIEGNTVSVNTSQGPVLATIGDDTTIQMFVQGTLADLREGLTVTVIGPQGEDGTVEARSIAIVPEGGVGLFGGGLPAGDRFQRAQP